MLGLMTGGRAMGRKRAVWRVHGWSVETACGVHAGWNDLMERGEVTGERHGGKGSRRQPVTRSQATGHSAVCLELAVWRLTRALHVT